MEKLYYSDCWELWASTSPRTWRSYYIGGWPFALPKLFPFAEMRKIAELVHEPRNWLLPLTCPSCTKVWWCSQTTYFSLKKSRQIISRWWCRSFYICNRDKRPSNDLWCFNHGNSSRQINFWGKQAGAEAVLPSWDSGSELFCHGWKSSNSMKFCLWCKHHSPLKRPLLPNYYNFIKTDEVVTKECDSSLSGARRSRFTTQFMKITYYYLCQQWLDSGWLNFQNSLNMVLTTGWTAFIAQVKLCKNHWVF